MNPAILDLEVQEFINSHLNSDVTKLLLKGSPFKQVTIKELVEQIEAKNKCHNKLPIWHKTRNIYYPNKLNIEQTSSEVSANYKSQLLRGHHIIDLTGGFGVDSFYFSKNFKTVTHCECNSRLSNIAKHNYQALEAKNIHVVDQEGLNYLKSSKKQYDWVYIDPSRRHDSKGKVIFLKDCLPNVPEHLELLFKHSNKLMVKTSPLLDISVGISELKYVKTIHIVAINNDVKELLWILEKDYIEDIVIETVNIKKELKETFRFKLIDEASLKIPYSQPLTYLYEPNASILKAGAFKSTANQLGLFKLHQHSHLYTSDAIIKFPGRRFRIIKVIPYNKKGLKKEGLDKANVTTRNFPETVAQIRKKYSIKEGGQKYVFFTTSLLNIKYVIFTEKL